MRKAISPNTSPGTILETSRRFYRPGDRVVCDLSARYVFGKPVGGARVEGLEAQVEQVLENLKSIVEESGGSMGSIVKATVLLRAMDDFKAMNGIYAGYFESDPPARAAFEVGALPLGALVEIEAIALLD